MSVRINRNYSRSTTVSQSPVKKYCGVCQKAGLSESQYTSHFTKSAPGPQGIVICPTILNNECTFCYQFGHFKSACPAVIERNRQDKKAEIYEKRAQHQKKQLVSAVVSINRGGFSALDSDSDSEQESFEKPAKSIATKRTFSEANKPAKVAKVEEWPALSTKPVVNMVGTVDKPSFATVISSPAPVKVALSGPNICGFTVISKTGTLDKPSVKTGFRSNWADYSDSDDDDVEDNTAW